MIQEWRAIQGFPCYSVSDAGFVRNDETGRIMTLLVNQHGVVNVGLTRNQVQHKRSVAVLVAHAFVTTAKSLSFNTPINLDGDRLNNRASNLVWRPRWFATQYFQQFNAKSGDLLGPVEEMNDEEYFETSWDAATHYGLLDVKVRISTTDQSVVWPTYQRFRIVN